MGCDLTRLMVLAAIGSCRRSQGFVSSVHRIGSRGLDVRWLNGLALMACAVHFTLLARSWRVRPWWSQGGSQSSRCGFRSFSLQSRPGCASAHCQEKKGGIGAKANARQPASPRRDYVATGSISELVFVPAVCEELNISPKQRQVVLDAKLRAASFEEIGQINTSLRNAGLDLQRAVHRETPSGLPRPKASWP